jgi:ParB/RepB/Spo0J family partition protein
VPLKSIECNRFNSRIAYSATSIERMSKSLAENGQLALVKVRRTGKHPGTFELVYGHRRYLAAKHLGWKTIRAEVAEINDEKAAQESLIENFERDELTDYEKALVFERLNKEFQMTYEEIGKRLAISKQHVSNYISMLNLFSAEFLSTNPDVREVVHQISEHHARLLLRIEDTASRADLAKKISKEKLTVKELTNIVTRLRSWYGTTKVNYDQVREESPEAKTKREISDLLTDKFKLAHLGKFPEDLFDYRFSIYSAFPPYEKVEYDNAISRVRNWFCKDAPKLTSSINNLKVELLGQVALVTLDICYSGEVLGDHSRLRAGGTIVLTNKNGMWKILHEHWSNLDIPAFGARVEMNVRTSKKSIPKAHL